jgi:23S rRNA (pseudouridine1915-N3)-methyltransferase
MEITILMIHKTSDKFISEGMQYYLHKANPYLKVQTMELNAAASGSKESKNEEGRLILTKLKDTDYICLLDEKGKPFDSIGFAAHLQKVFNAGVKRLVFVIGGAYGFSEELKSRAHSVISLSPMTFSHQLVRIVFAEQLYRALNIMHGGKYHH